MNLSPRITLPLLAALLACFLVACITTSSAPAQVRIALLNSPAVFGEKEKDTPDNPAIVEEPGFSMIRGTRSALIIASGAAEEYKPVLYVEPKRNSGVKKESLKAELDAVLKKLEVTWPGIYAEPFETGFRVIIPTK
jgi:hypothetical protein